MSTDRYRHPASVVDEAINRLKDRIGAGDFAPGSQLPPAAVLAAGLNLSRLSLREAVRALVMAGVLEVRRGTGTFVTDLKPERLVSAIGRFLELADDTAVGELFECRRILEPGATALAATRIGEPELAALAGKLDKMGTLQDPEELVREDLEFHAAIVAAAGNLTLRSLAASVAQHTARARIWRAVVKSDVLDWTHRQHTEIYEALAARDSLTAFMTATRHVTEVEQWVRQRLESGLSELG
jgi:GntR family transcriptional regulator, transcriptional repressor for pyruvate dehydrogenase complex